jgi:hypothetical protein
MALNMNFVGNTNQVARTTGETTWLWTFPDLRFFTHIAKPQTASTSDHLYFSAHDSPQRIHFVWGSEAQKPLAWDRGNTRKIGGVIREVANSQHKFN